ncbi:MAG: ABC transporter substrate-binding protein [Lachnospiraceae bacterium]|nr:ABC transporter substrate-binding protein [Lachnospiraceae bacterium]
MKNRFIKNNIVIKMAAGFISAALILSGCASSSDNTDSTENITADINIDEDNTVEDDITEVNTIDNAPAGDEYVSVEVTFPVTLTDALGREVTIESADRVATLLGSFADMWYLAGGEVVATASDTWTNFDLGLDESVVNVGSILNPDLELLVAAEPDLVIASAGNSAQIELEDALTSTGITVVYFEVSDFDDYKEVLGVMTDITGRKDLYKTYALDVEKDVQAQKERAAEAASADGFEAPTVLFIRAAASSVKAKGSTGTVGGEILADIGTVNIADTDGTLLEDLSLEAIVAADPDYIFVTTQGEDTEAALANVEELLKSNPAWSSLTAVQNGNYYEIDKSLYNSKPNARWAEAYKILVDIIYGE